MSAPRPSRVSQRLLLALALGAAVSATAAELNPLFTDHAVLQQGERIPIWGTGRPGERVDVSFAGQHVATTVANSGDWRVDFDAVKAGGPYELNVKADDTITLHDVLVGEVWIASGQSNMERQLGPRPPQKDIYQWKEEVAAADHPMIRQIELEHRLSYEPKTTAEMARGGWQVCTPENVANFTAVGYFFARDLEAARHVPIGIIHSSWGGTYIQAWTSAATLARQPSAAPELAALDQARLKLAAGDYDFSAMMDAWFTANDPGSSSSAHFGSSETPDGEGWQPVTVPDPTAWADSDLASFDGIVWYRYEFDLPKSWDGIPAMLELGPIDDMDSTYVNGVVIGFTNGWQTPRTYMVPPGTLHEGKNLIAIRVFDGAGGGGLYGRPEQLKLDGLVPGVAPATIPLAGIWKIHVGPSLKDLPARPVDLFQNANQPTVLYNAMIAPLIPYAIRGVIWYQGENNAQQARAYRDLMPALISDWRDLWHQPDMPFLYVQIAPFKDIGPEIREAQLLTLARTQNTAMAVTIDCGDAKDIHPPHKQPVGARLALAARAIAYGEKIEYSGPLFKDVTPEAGKLVVHFTHADGLVAQGDTPLRGFEVAGSDGKFHPATATIKGDSVILSAPEVTAPVNARYAWANVADGNLFNAAGLPASPFRSNPN